MKLVRRYCEMCRAERLDEDEAAAEDLPRHHSS
jgi:hypothetical protein